MPGDIARAWNSVTDEWWVRRNKRQAEPWEVVHHWGGDVISDSTMRVLKNFADKADAEAYAKGLEEITREQAVVVFLSGLVIEMTRRADDPAKREAFLDVRVMLAGGSE
jgi:hypothetical protein